MWCDDFDLDIYKVFPESIQTLEPLKDIIIHTYGNGEDYDLNHPSVWNQRIGMVAFFGLASVGYIPSCYWTDEHCIQTSAEQCIRDAYLHHYVILIDTIYYPELNFFNNNFKNAFYTVLHHIRIRKHDINSKGFEISKRYILGKINLAASIIIELSQAPGYPILKGGEFGKR